MVAWAHEKPVVMGLPAVVEFKTEIEDISPISVEEILRKMANNPL